MSTMTTSITCREIPESRDKTQVPLARVGPKTTLSKSRSMEASSHYHTPKFTHSRRHSSSITNQPFWFVLPSGIAFSQNLLFSTMSTSLHSLPTPWRLLLTYRQTLRSTFETHTFFLSLSLSDVCIISISAQALGLRQRSTSWCSWPWALAGPRSVA